MRIWVDGCFDFFHHGHAGALQQARTLGDALIVGIHTDAEILHNKGPVVMQLSERELAVASCRWTTQQVVGAPYVTDPAFMLKYGCEYVAHGDDITTDANGNDCYQQLKDANRFLEFKRTPNISTTDLIGRMLSHSTVHHAEADYAALNSIDAQRRFEMYATASDAKSPYAAVWHSAGPTLETFVAPNWPKTAKSICYIEGTFDLFHCGHIEFLKRAHEHYAGAALIVVGLRSDKDANARTGDGCPIMNIFERALCVLQCKYVDGVILNVPNASDPSSWVASLQSQLGLPIDAVAYGAKPVIDDRLHEWATESGKALNISGGEYAAIRTSTIVDRVLTNRQQYEERQRKKGVKSVSELEIKQSRTRS